jgi:hypothetical protein
MERNVPSTEGDIVPEDGEVFRRVPEEGATIA